MLKVIAVLSLIALAWEKEEKKSTSSVVFECPIEKVPYNAAVLFFEYLLCGGVILTEKYILTTATCVDGVQIYTFSVVAGNVNWRDKENAQTSFLTEMHINPDFISGSKDGDFAILELETPFKFNEKVGPISLATEPAKEGDVGYVSGWGDESYPLGHQSKVLKIVDVTVVDFKTCKSIFDRYGYSENMICAGDLGVGGKDFCEYDSGAPLVINEKLAGIASWGIECGHPDYPGIYTNILNERYLEFINHVISK